MTINMLLETRGFAPAHHVEGREAIANLFPQERRCGIYVLHFADNRYYVGQSVDVTRRYVEHRQNHTDIVKLSFKSVARPNLTAVERADIEYFQTQGLVLRNTQWANLPPGLADFDLLMSPEDQERWLSDVTIVDFNGSRMIDPTLRSKYTGKFARFRQKPHANDVVDVLRAYVAAGIPRARASEVSFWSCSCLPEASVYARVNLNWQEVLTAFTVAGQLLFSFHLARSPFNFGKAFTEYVQRFPGLDVVIALDDEGYFVVNGRGEERARQALLTQEHVEMSKALSEPLSAFFEAFPDVVISSEGYTPGGNDQIRIIAQETDTAHRLLADEQVRLAVRRLNMRLIRKGPCPYRTSHCLDLADQVIR